MVPVTSVTLQVKNRKNLFPKLIDKKRITLSTDGKIIACIGSNATGKTTFLQLIEDAVSKKKTGNVRCGINLLNGQVYNSIVHINDVAELLKFEPEKYSKFSNIIDYVKSSERLLDLKMFRASEGECASYYFEDFYTDNLDLLISGKPFIVLINEPENYLDPKTLQSFLAAIKSWVNNNPYNSKGQIFITTHSLFVIDAADIVIEFEPNYKHELAKQYLDISTKFMKDDLLHNPNTRQCIHFCGSLTNKNDLPKTASQGDMYSIGPTQYIYDGSQWNTFKL